MCNKSIEVSYTTSFLARGSRGTRKNPEEPGGTGSGTAAEIKCLQEVFKPFRHF